jgi:hypothetical protein
MMQQSGFCQTVPPLSQSGLLRATCFLLPQIFDLCSILSNTSIQSHVLGGRLAESILHVVMSVTALLQMLVSKSMFVYSMIVSLT